jgi:hypothetical protein
VAAPLSTLRRSPGYDDDIIYGIYLITIIYLIKKGRKKRNNKQIGETRKSNKSCDKGKLTGERGH